MKHILFYDGECALCHFWVGFVIARDREGSFQFAPISALGEERLRAELGDTLVVLDEKNAIHRYSDGVLFILSQLGGWWRGGSALLRVIPRPLRDLGYRLVAAIRKKILPKPSGVCPIVSVELRNRFLLEFTPDEQQRIFSLLKANDT
ncbi:DUF393 domain-containing protein [bacterium]|nr:DUF393 domain-containing protein [bacterium]